ncbi:MAG: NAD(P)H-binding protein [Chloroflexota bacterium]
MAWMIYGATGYTGQLVVAEAVARGHRPLLAGRNPEKLATLADTYDLDFVAFQLDDPTVIAEAIADMDVVYHAAGPFVYTSEPMIRACLATHTHYLDITGEIDVFEQTFSYDDAARKVGIALISGVGFDVVPTDCLAAYVAGQVTGATELNIGVFGLYGASAGTTKSAIEMLPGKWYTRRDGKLTSGSFGKDTHTFTLPNGKKRHGMSAPWGDLSVAYRTTGIPNITSYLDMPSSAVTMGRVFYPVAKQLFKLDAVRSFASDLVDSRVTGPDDEARETGKSYLYAEARNPAGQSAAAWLTTLEPYQYTAKVGVLAVEEALHLDAIGTLTPAQAFGADFTLQVDNTVREDV